MSQLLSYSVVVLLLLLSLLLFVSLLVCAFCVCVCVCVCQGAGGSELPLTATHIYNRTENKTTAVTYKVSISIHQYWRFILSLARSNALAHTFHAGAALFQTDLWVRPILRVRAFARARRDSPNRHAAPTRRVAPVGERRSAKFADLRGSLLSPDSRLYPPRGGWRRHVATLQGYWCERSTR